ncbi:MAG: response regulator [Defluviitaleaceae bacterium]|nr:response regulator [Defluviitaleaceae bacterium]
MKTIFIAENNVAHLKMLRKWINDEFPDLLVLVAKTFEEGRDIVEHQHIDLFLLDINLTKGQDELGIQLAEEIREKYPYNTIVFQTVEYDAAFQIDVHERIGSAVYLVKQDLTKQRLIATIYRELDRFETPLTSFIFIKERSDRTVFPTHDIVRIEKVSNEHDTRFFIYDPKNDSVKMKTFRVSLSEIMDQSGAEGFLIRCHQSHIINQKLMEYTTVENSMHKVKIEREDTLIPIGRTFKDGVLKGLERKLRR